MEKVFSTSEGLSQYLSEKADFTSFFLNSKITHAEAYLGIFGPNRLTEGLNLTDAKALHIKYHIFTKDYKL